MRIGQTLLAVVLLTTPALADEDSDSDSKTVTTDSGLVITELRAGTGEHPTRTSTVQVHYHGTLEDGTVFDSSVERGKPATFPLNRVIKCWTEGVQMMREGGESRLVCPGKIAYGPRGRLCYDAANS